MKNMRERIESAIQKGDVRSARVFIALAKQLVNEPHPVTGETFLHLAARYAQLDIVQYLVEEQKASVNALDKEKNTPLNACIKSTAQESVADQILVIAYLLQNKADPALGQEADKPYHHFKKILESRTVSDDKILKAAAEDIMQNSLQPSAKKAEESHSLSQNPQGFVAHISPKKSVEALSQENRSAEYPFS